MKKSFIAIALLVFLVQFADAQQRKKTPVKRKATTTRQAEKSSADTTIPSRTVTVTSSYKPELKPAAKVNFSAAAPPADSVLPTLQYNVPSQNLFFAYQPAALKPLAADIDTAMHWENSNYVKAGFGNYATPFLQAGLSFGDGNKSIVNVHAKYISSKGNMPFQQYSNADVDATGIITNGVNEFTGKIFYNNRTRYQYGFQPDSLLFPKDDLRNRFNTFGAKVGMRNKTINSMGINYNPSLYIDGFTDGKNGNETNLILDAPVSKAFGDNFIFNFGITANLTGYKSDSAGKINNNLVYLSPAVQYGANAFKIVAGITPSWDNKDFYLLPNFTAEAKINEEKFVLMAGWTGYYNKNSYESLSEFNPWLQQPKFLKSTRITEQYAGFKGSAGSHVTYNAKVSYLHLRNQPLFVNDTITGKSFYMVNESDMKDIRLHGELGYTIQEKLSFLAGASINKYSNLTDNDKAYGLLPIDINGSLRWQVTKDVLFKSDVYFWDGPRYLTISKELRRLDPAFDLNAGAEVKLTGNFSAWLQFNNLFNNKYQRWNQYPVLGFNVLGGIIYSFGQKTGQ
ncbi:hypothetical protein FC093_06515 [Ilyomonas limi]|uniref:TonB-dependent receptor n=1 Tax=Ilyomonas limi TaxID=2575867 RepID=A0A4U3L450_9BACT|nr:hypothetical protein [Ilyomonas limi]TKK69740.1 hypothetical protein FC093_06515 [Ilyomonas limi]